MNNDENFYDELSSLQIENTNLKSEVHHLQQLLELYSTEPLLANIVQDYVLYTRQIIRKLVRYFNIVEYDPNSSKHLNDLLNANDRLRNEIEKLQFK